MVAKNVRQSRTVFDGVVRGAIGLHLLADAVALWVAYHAAILWQYVAIRLFEAPLVLIMLVIYLKSRPRA